MTDIEIPYPLERNKLYRFWEILPGAVSWSILLLPLVLSVVNPGVLVIFYIAYLLLWFMKAIGMNVRSLQGYHMMKQQASLEWKYLLDDLENGDLCHPHAKNPQWHLNNIQRISGTDYIKPSELYHAIIVATYNEELAVVEPTIVSVMESHYDLSKVILILAYEERGGADIAEQSKELIKKYGKHFGHAMAIMHPKDIPNEVIGKGGNITYAGRVLQAYLEEKKIDPIDVVVTTLDADNRPHKYYLAALSYTYCSTEDQRYVSYQPVPMYTNNIWDAPAPMRVIATGNSFWNIVLSLRPHMLRNFSSHAQSMQALIDTDFWSTRTIVEDGHQFWRTYFAYDGRHEVFPIFLPIYQDAVLAATYRRTLRQQFIQLRRWAWGASDIAYVATKGFGKESRAPKLDVIMKLARLFEGHISWATASLLIILAPVIPSTIRPESYVANQLPNLASTIQNIALMGIFVTLFLSMKSLPPKPARYKAHRTVFMILQWVLLPITTIAYNTLAAINSQTRLMCGKYLGKFDVTEKAVKK